jgi:hypothetical protein
MKIYQSIAIICLLLTASLAAPTPRGTSSAHNLRALRRQQSNITDAGPSPVAPGTEGGNTGGGQFVAYSGPASNYPDPSQWISFFALWDLSVPQMSAMGNTESENALIQSSILTVASSSGVDARAILATVMQESTGKVRVGTTNNGVSNSGLMQSHAGTSFDPADPAGSILQMIRDGTEGTAHGDGLMQTLAAQNGNYYEAFRKYNSGSVNTADLNDGFGSSPLYVQQMANRLMGVL